MPPDAQLIQDIAIELGVDPAFVEKDWYAIQVLAAISVIKPDQIEVVFCGGTCLSKAYGLLKRFSEDLDFRGHFISTRTPPKSVRRQFRESVLTNLEAIDWIELDREQVKCGSNYFKFPLQHPQEFRTPDGLRPRLQVEFSYNQPRRAVEARSVQSFVSEFSGDKPEAKIPCLQPLETAADKLCALTWRVLKRDRNDKADDPAMIRHLHDLGALHPIILAEPIQFSETALASFAVDMQSSPRRMDQDLPTAALMAFGELKTDIAYTDEYGQFVTNMSYEKHDEQLDFQAALARMDEVIAVFE
jgi:hypothetical protein